jgi:hypothetical protein
MVMAHFLPLVLTCFLLILGIGNSEIGPVGNARNAYDVAVCDAPICAHINGCFAPRIMKIPRVHRIQKSIGLMGRAGYKYSKSLQTAAHSGR